jgi:hypothetical protein
MPRTREDAIKEFYGHFRPNHYPAFTVLNPRASIIPALKYVGQTFGRGSHTIIPVLVYLFIYFNPRTP